MTPLLLVCLFAACGNGEGQTTDEARHRHHPDAAVAADAPVTSSGGTISCYTEGNPGATCSSPDHCCFNNYSSQHDGYCTTSTCAYGTILCDGPEDCASGERCCAHAITDPVDGTTGYMIACQATACGAPPLNQELCHLASTCTTGTACVSAAIADYDLPRTLSVCE